MDPVIGLNRVGYATSMVCDDVGSAYSNALDAEATAIVAGAEYILSRQDVPGLQVVFHSDALAVGHGASGAQNLPHLKEGLSERQHAARVLMSILHQRAKQVQGLHVKAHDGQPWNACADSFATMTRKG